MQPVGRVSGWFRSEETRLLKIMHTLRRIDIKNTLYFVTVVTRNRDSVLLKDVETFWLCWKVNRPVAWAILPNHFHAIIAVGNSGISNIIHDFKIRYSFRHRMQYGTGKIWQNRFWDHVIRDEKDLQHHLNYTHYNPVKHGIVSDPFDYKFSSINHFYNSDSFNRTLYNIDEDIFSDFGE
jgi:putative transposase